MARLRTAAFLFSTTLFLLAGWAGLDPHATAGETVLLDFSSPSCGPCRQMRPTIERLSAAGYPVREVDVLTDHALAARYQVTQVPAFVLLVDGREFARLIGATSYDQLEGMFQAARISPQHDQPPAPSPSQLALAETSTIQRSRQTPSTAGSTSSITGSASSAPLLESAVRISVQDADGNSTGTGTVVDARSGEALILTCGHLFRSSGGKGVITVTLFQAGPAGAEPRTTLEGRLVDYDLQRDLGLLSVRTNEPVRVAPIAPPGMALKQGEPVTTLGCNHGENPTAIATRVTSLGRYQGPPNVEVAGTPVEGRSGGGLFNAAGQLVGVCFAADPQANEGLYSAVDSVHAKLDSLGLAMIYQTPSLGLPQPNGGAIAPMLAGTTPAGMTQLAANPSQQPFAVRGQEPATAPTSAFPPFPPATTPTQTASRNSSAPLAPSSTTPNLSLSAAERATLEEIVRRGANSEVICIIRPQTPGGKSEVITLTNASANFVRALAAPAAGTQTAERQARR